MFFYVSKVYSKFQNNPKHKDDLTEAKNVRKKYINTFEIMLNIAMLLE